jgi:hypothetical protein
VSYVSKKLSDAQLEALYDLSPEELRSLDVDRRMELVIQHRDLAVRRREAFWNAVTAFATGAIPIMAFFGLISSTRK